MTQARTRKPVKFGTVSGQVMALFLDSHTPEYRIEDNKRQMIWDMATAINKELRELVASGCSVIQVEEPTIHFIACYHPEATETLNFLTEVLNHELSGLDAAEVWIHTCWGNPMMQRVFDKTSYANALEIYLDRINCDILTLEMKDRAFAEIELLGAWKGKIRKKLAIGVVSHRTLNAETPEEVAQDSRKALKYVNVDIGLWLWSARRQSPGSILQKCRSRTGR
jgi:5-methyltetrahydropteroyltriglutamate--homocysteine methyltransferase